MQAVEPETPRPTVDGDTALVLQLFGAITVCLEGRPLPRLRTRKELWLLALLTLQGSEAPIERTRLAGMLWPEASDSRALSNLRRSLSGLRDALGAEAWRIGSPTPRTLQLDLSGARCDVLEFDRMARSSDEASLHWAAALYRGPLLQGCFEDWIVSERESRQQAMLAALETLTAQAKRRGDLADAASHLRRALQIDPFREPVLRALMQTLADQGSHAAAGEVYRAFRLELRRTLNADPSGETVRLSRDIRAAAQRDAQQAAASAHDAKAPASTARYRLPAALSPLVGRQAESAAVIRQLRSGRLVTLTGTGGAGKTRLGLAVAEELNADFDEGVCFIDLSTLSDSAHIPMLILSELGESEPEKGETVAALEEFLHPRNLLILLDNCEHLREDCARLARTLLGKCPRLRLLATSREPLHVPGEVVWPVPSLVPAEAARLFAERAAQARFGFRMTEANAEAVDRVCRRLAGMPLAIEMAAARVRGMSVPQIASEMDDVVRLLNQRGGNQDARQQTLRGTLDWSYRLLNATEQTLLTRLSLFAGGCSLALATAVCGDGLLLAEDIPDSMLSLVEKSLVEFTERPSGECRYRLLETTRAYAAEMLSAEEHARLSDRRVDYFVQQAKHLLRMQGHPEGGENEFLLGLEAELPNIRATLAWCLLGGDRTERGLLIAGYLWKFWWVRGHITEGRQHILAALGRASDDADFSEKRASALRAIGVLAYFQYDFDAAQDYYEQALRITRALDDGGDTASILLNLGLLFTAKGDLVQARERLHEALDIFFAVGVEHCVQKCRHALADISLAEGDLEGAKESYVQLFQHYERVGDLLHLAGTCNALASVCRESAVRFPESAEAAAREERAYVTKGLKIHVSLADATGIATCLELLANLAVRQDRFHEATILHGAGSAIRESADGTRLGADELAAIDDDNRRSSDALGDAEFEAARTEGKAMSVEKAAAYALCRE